MKILLLDNSSLTPISGALCCEIKTGKFAAELKNLGHDVTLYGQIVRKKNTVHAFDLNEQGVGVVGLKRKKNKIVNYLILYFLIIPQVVRSDFVYIFYPSVLKYVSIICWLSRTPYGLYVRGEQGLKTKTSKVIYKKAFAIFTVSSYFTKLVGALTKNESIYTIRPMIDLSDKDIVEDRVYSVKSHYTILFLARLEEDKGVKELLHAVKRLKQEKYSFTLNLVGDGGYLPQARRLVDQLDIADAVSIKGAVLDSEEVRQLYLAADLYVLPTYHEGFPRTLYEAMIFGVPIITTFVGGISSVMIDKFNCLEIEPKSVESIVDRLGYAISNYAVMTAYAGNGVETVAPLVESTRLSHVEHLSKVISVI